MSTPASGLPKITHAVPNLAWLAQHREEVLEPGLPIIDPHHHLWDHHGGYFLDDLLNDTGSGHNIIATVSLQWGYAYRKSGPEELKPVGETEFVVGIASEADRRRADTRACAGIVKLGGMTAARSKRASRELRGREFRLRRGRIGASGLAVRRAADARPAGDGVRALSRGAASRHMAVDLQRSVIVTDNEMLLVTRACAGLSYEVIGRR